MPAIMAASFVFAGHQMASMFSPEAKTIWCPSGQLPSLQLLLVAKAINLGLQLFASILGDVTTEITVSVALAKTVGSCCGISA